MHTYIHILVHNENVFVNCDLTYKTEELMLLNCGAGEDSWESLGLQGDPTSPSQRRPVLGVHWEDWCWGWNSSTLATSWEELTHWKRPWCWEGLGAGGKGDDRGWDGRWHHQLDPHEFGWTPGVGDGQGGLACCNSWGCKESDTTERLNWIYKTFEQQWPLDFPDGLVVKTLCSQCRGLGFDSWSGN